MQLSLFLAQFLGLYFLIFGLAIILRAKFFRKLCSSFVENSAAMFVGGGIGVLLGLFLVLSHNIWQDAWRILITLICWIVLLKGLFLVFFTETAQNITKMCKAHSGNIIIGVIYLVLAAYLLYQGFVY